MLWGGGSDVLRLVARTLIGSKKAVLESENTYGTEPTRRAKTLKGVHCKLAEFERAVRLVDWAEMAARRRERMMRGE